MNLIDYHYDRLAEFSAKNICQDYLKFFQKWLILVGIGGIRLSILPFLNIILFNITYEKNRKRNRYHSKF